MDRRKFTQLAFASAVSASSSCFASQYKESNTVPDCIFGAYDDDEGKHYIAQLSLEVLNNRYDNDAFRRESIPSGHSIEIPFRAHGTLPLSGRKSLSFGRRPHNQMVVCDFEKQQTQIIEAQEGRHFYGHGCLHQESQTLFTTENDYDQVRGVIALRDSQNFHQIGEYESYGIGPHDIHIMPDRKTLVVANGGIQTHPDFGRRKLNIKSMQPSLVFIDISSGKKIDEYRLIDHQLSIRHLSVTSTGEVGVATQYQGSFAQKVPEYLLACFDRTGLHSFKETQEFTRSCKGYIADVAIDSKAKILAATSPRGNNMSLWDMTDFRLIKSINLPAPSAICFDDTNQQFLVSNDKGFVFSISTDAQISSRELKKFPVKWDNHMILAV